MNEFTVMTTAATPIRIVFISEAYPPTSGGVATSAQRIARNLARIGCSVLVLTFDGSKPLTDDDYVLIERDENVEVRRIGPFFLKQPNAEMERISEKIRAVFRRRAFDQMEHLAREFQPAIVLSFYVVNAGFLATYVARSLGVPHVVGVRGNDIGRNIFSLDRLAAVQMAIEGSAHIVCVNEHLRRRLSLAFPRAADRSSVIMNGVELPFSLERKDREYTAAKLSWPTSDTIAVFIGTPREKKGISLLLSAVEIARNQVPLRLLIVGPSMGPAERRQCGDRWDRLQACNALHATGQLARHEALRIAAEGDLVVMPSIEDGLANGLLEGMALGLCPVVSDLFADIVPNGEAGFVAGRNCAELLAGAFVKAVTSRKHQLQCADTAKARAKAAHAPSQEAQRYLRLFEEIIG